MGAESRLAMDWLKRFYLYHNRLGTNLSRYSNLNRMQSFNFYRLFRLVQTNGGSDLIRENDFWNKISGQLKLDESIKPDFSDPEYLKSLYLDVIHPFDTHVNFLKSIGITNEDSKLSECNLHARKPKVAARLENSENHKGADTISEPTSKDNENNTSNISRRLRHRDHINMLDTTDDNYDDGPKAKDVKASLHRRRKQQEQTMSMRNYIESNDISLTDTEGDSSKLDSEYISLCEVCDSGCHENYISCESCDGEFHKECITNSDIFLYHLENSKRRSSKKWACPTCLVGSCEFGFQKGEVYTLSEFQEKAELFKEEFLKEKALDSSAVIDIERATEKLFWSYIESINETVSVEYGSDIRSTTSGFPLSVETSRNKYARDSWNLNNLPLSKDSLFSNLNTDIPGMNIPWLYVGMMFSTFCWHSEDHYTYSVNYQHFGDTKTWYGVPGKDAEKFELAMKEIVPELFEKQPDLLSQLVTMVSPEKLIEKGVHVYVIDQRPGEFVITLPKAYHAGFNHGFNLNEAVNFTPPGWLSFGAESMKTYQLQHRPPVFSFDQLMIRIAQYDKRKKTAKWFHPCFSEFTKREILIRKILLDRFLSAKTLVVRDELPEEKYQCSICKSLPYLTRIVLTAIKNNPTEYHKPSTETNIKRPVGRPKKVKVENRPVDSINRVKSEEKNSLDRSLAIASSRVHKNGPLKKNHTKLQMDSYFSMLREKYDNHIQAVNITAENLEFTDKDSIVFCPLHAPEIVNTSKTVHVELHVRFTDEELLNMTDTIKLRL